MRPVKEYPEWGSAKRDPMDYTVLGGEYWTFETVTAWLERFHIAIHTLARAADPAGFERFLQSLRDLMSKKGA